MTVEGVKRSSASASVSVCPHVKTKTTIVAKLATGIVHHESSLATHLMLGQRSQVKVIWSQSAKDVEGDRVAGVSLH